MASLEVIALDGPGGVGKSSTARALAQRLGYFFLSSGQIYRALAWSALEGGWRPGEPLPGGLLDQVRIEVERDGALKVNGQVPGAALHTDVISQATSILSALPEARALSNRVQRDTVSALARSGHFPGVVLEGRDIGTVVFPEARHKFFITASQAVRAERRYRELDRSDPGASLETVRQALDERDRRDSERELAPLRPAPGAIVMDTSAMSFEQVLERLVREVRVADESPR